MKYSGNKGNKRARRKMLRSAKQERRAKKGSLYVAVVVSHTATPDYSLAAGAPGGNWSCFVGEVQSEVVGRAMEAARKWGQYQIWTGTLTGKAVFQTIFKVVAL